MALPAIPDELARLADLRRYLLLDTHPEPEFDRITQLAARVFEVPIALISFVDAERQWFKSRVGLEVTETRREAAFCAHAIAGRGVMVVPDATLDPRFATSPLVTDHPKVRFYAGAPLISASGHALGALCINDTRPRTLSTDQVATLEALAAIVVDLVEARLGFRAREMFEKVAEVSPNVIYVFDLAHQRNVFGNQVMTELLGFVPATAGDRFLDLAMHPEDRASYASHQARMAAESDGVVAEVSFRLKAANGEYRAFSARETVFERGARGEVTRIVGVANDVSKLEHAELEARKTAELLQKVLATAGEGIVAADEHGKLTLFNPAAERILGLGEEPDETTRDGAYGVFDLEGNAIPPDELPLARALRGEVTECREMVVRDRKTPTGRYVITSGHPLEGGTSGRHRGCVVTFRDVTPLKTAQLALAELAVTDELTGLPNKRALRDRLAILAREGRRGRKFATVVVDVDHFKAVNDTHGHPVGDAVLRHIGQTLRAQVRSTDFVARYGGEEFVVLYTDVDEAVAAALAEHLREAIASSGGPVRVTASFGVCGNAGELAGDGEAMIALADQALYRAKRAGRNRVVSYHPTALVSARGTTQSIPLLTLVG